MPLATSFALAVTFAFGGMTPALTPALQPMQTVGEYVADYFSDIPIMVVISSCESHYRQYDTNGAVYRGYVNNQDVGVMQINEHYHLENSKKLGFDIYTMQGNVAYARYLYEREGVAPWASSSPCWNKTKRPAAVAEAPQTLAPVTPVLAKK